MNAAGPWIDEIRRLEDARAGTSVTLSRGAHLVLERNGGWGAALTIPIDRTRVAFAVPWAGMLLLGTTDSAFEGDARAIEPTVAEERQILDEAGLALDADALGDVRARFAGVRVMPVMEPRCDCAWRQPRHGGATGTHPHAGKAGAPVAQRIGVEGKPSLFEDLSLLGDGRLDRAGVALEGGVVVPSSSIPAQGTANATRVRSIGIVSAAPQPPLRSSTRCAPLLRVTEVPARASSSRRISSIHGPAASCGAAGTSTVSPESVSRS